MEYSIYYAYALVAGSIFFGSFTIILSTRMKSSEGYNVISNGLFLFFAFVSSAFYPTEGLPQPLSVVLPRQSVNLYSGYYQSEDIRTSKPCFAILKW